MNRELDEDDPIWDEILDPTDGVAETLGLECPDGSAITIHPVVDDGSSGSDHVTNGGCEDGGDPSQTTPGDGDQTATGESDQPVDVFSGFKLERATDLSVSLPGSDFQITRMYTSDPGHTGPGLVGRGWTLSVFSYLMLDDADGCDGLRLFAMCGGSDGGCWRVGGRHLYMPCLGQQTDEWAPEGPNRFQAHETSITIDSTQINVYRIYEPGKWEKFYYRTPSGSKNGLLLQERDWYGNVRTYKYTDYGSSGTIPRLTTIFLNGTPESDDEDAQVQLFWDLDGDSDNKGRLLYIRVLRRSGSNWTETQRVTYTYHGTTGDDLGSLGDLIQVTKQSVVDNGIRELITQYRYHRDEVTADPYETDERQTVVGGDFQLKMVINPEQIEWIAQKRNEDGQMYSDYSETLRETAAELLAMDDDAVVLDLPSDDILLLDLASKIIGYETSGDMRVTRQYLQSGCGCGGGEGAQAVKQAFDYYQPSTTEHALKITETTYDDTSGAYDDDFRIKYYDVEAKRHSTGGGLPDYEGVYLDNYAIVEPGQNGREWVWHFQYNGSGQDPAYTLARIVTPSALSSYTPADANNPASYSASATAGLAFGYSFTSDNRVSGRYVREGYDPSNDDLGTDFTKLMGITYGGANAPSWAVSKIERYRVEGSTAVNDIETTEYEYDYHTNGLYTDTVAWKKTIFEAELSTENGPSGTGNTYATYELYDEDTGLLFWYRDEDGALTFYDYDSSTGKASMIVRNADKTGSGDADALSGSDYGGITIDGSWGRSSDGGELTTTYLHDKMGRVTKRTSPGGVETKYSREMRDFDSDFASANRERKGIYYYAEVMEPPYWIDLSSNYHFGGPGHVTWYSAGGNAIRSSDFEMTTQGNPPVIILGDELSRSTVQHSFTGAVESERRWADLDSETSYYETTYAYDTAGRLESTENDVGTITEYDRDALGRVTAQRVGTSTATSTVAEYFYDHTMNGSVPVQGMGNGNLSYVRLYTGEESGGSPVYRDTVTVFDYRDRPVITFNPEKPNEYVGYDNLGRVVGRALFSTDSLTIAGGLDQQLSYRGMYADTQYSQRGMVYKQRVEVDPTITSGSGSYLETNRWFDEVGRTLAQASPNSPGSKHTYDGLGRTKVTYSTDLGGDSGYSDVDDVTGDTVFEQSAYTYFTGITGTDHLGLLKMVTRKLRPHDSTQTGDLDDQGSNAIATFQTVYYDEADRLTNQVNWGTNDTDGFITGTSAPTYGTAPDPSSTDATKLVTKSTYNSRGMVDRVESPDETLTKYLYDDLGRRIAVIENYEDAVVTWDGTNSRWTVSSGLEDAELDTDRVTSYVYDGSDNIIKLTAHMPDGSNGENIQTTEYVYGVTAGSPSNDDDSLVYSNNLLATVKYPDESTGNPGSTSAYWVNYAYDRLGEARYTEDQNGTEHIYSRDLAGRILTDQVGTLGTNIDGTVDQIAVTYDDFGRLESVQSLDDQSSVLNEVEFTYTPLWQVERIFQDQRGVVEYDGSYNPQNDTEVVKYTYDNETASSGNNHSRLEHLYYPDGAVIRTGYGSSSGSPDDLVSRPTRLHRFVVPSSLTPLVAYDYVGSGMVAQVDYIQPDIQLDRTMSHDGKRRTQGFTTQNAGEYPGWDQYGRVVRHPWVDGGLTVNGQESVPDRPPLVELVYGYDNASNRTSRTDARPGAGSIPGDGTESSYPDRDFRYYYDGLDRLQEAERGVQGPSSWYNGIGSQQWSLDMLGNWSEIDTDITGDGDYADSGETEDREHNMANELTERDPDDGQNAFALAYDDAGNIRTQVTSSSSGNRYTHDAWNRLVKVENGADQTWYTRNEFEYNGLNWRVIKREATSTPFNTLDEERTMYYSANWQLLEEHIDDDYVSDPGIDAIAQQVWGLRYIDDAVMKRIDGNADGDYGDAEDKGPFYYLTDAQFSTIAMVDETAVLIERVDYNAYGVARHHWPNDLDGDGDGNDGADATVFTTAQGSAIHESGYRANCDFDRDGDVDGTDASYANNHYGSSVLPALAAGRISRSQSTDNAIGYDGYLFNWPVGIYSVRFRHYDPLLGRWLERDRVRYIDGMNMYQYIASAAPNSTDSLGLVSTGTAEDLIDEYLSRYELANGILGDSSEENCIAHMMDMLYGVATTDVVGDIGVKTIFAPLEAAAGLTDKLLAKLSVSMLENLIQNIIDGDLTEDEILEMLMGTIGSSVGDEMGTGSETKLIEEMLKNLLRAGLSKATGDAKVLSRSASRTAKNLGAESVNCTFTVVAEETPRAPEWFGWWRPVFGSRVTDWTIVAVCKYTCTPAPCRTCPCGTSKTVTLGASKGDDG